MATSEKALNALPPNVRDDPVTQAFFRQIIKASASAQIAAARAALSAYAARSIAAPGGLTQAALDQWDDQIIHFSAPTKLTYKQLRQFAESVFDSKLNATLRSPAPGDLANGADAFEKYFRDYYDGKFVDRFGESITKPGVSASLPVSLTITDADIANAETVLLEYIFDLVDPTPVLGDADSASDVTSATNFWPGGKPASKPTVFGTGLARYAKIPASGCVISQQSIGVVVDVANAAGDRSATIGGLAFNAVGGFGVSLGVFGKISIGDNQTLSTLAKTAVSRFAKRVTYASILALYQGVAAPLPPGGPGGVSYTSYLSFAGNGDN